MPHIVIAEDEEDVREFFRRAFSRYAPHARVTACPDGVAALDVIRAQGCDLLISDHRMPVMTGIELLRAVRAFSGDLPVVIISADVSAEAEAIGASVTAFLYKPLTTAQIRMIIETWVAT